MSAALAASLTRAARIARPRTGDLLEEGGYVVRALRGELSGQSVTEECARIATAYARRYEHATSPEGRYGRVVGAAARVVALRAEYSAALVHPTGVLEGRAQRLAHDCDEAEQRAERWCRELLEEHAPSVSAVVTEHTASAHRAAREALERGLEDIKLSQGQLAGLVERGPSKVAQWVSGAAHAPLYLLAHAAVPEALRVRLRALAPATARVAVPIETTSALLVSDVGATLHSLGAALCDGKVCPEERRVLTPLVRQLRARCDQWLSRHGCDE